MAGLRSKLNKEKRKSGNVIKIAYLFGHIVEKGKLVDHLKHKKEKEKTELRGEKLTIFSRTHLGIH